MTLPVIVGKYKKQVTVSHLKKFYTTMNQALKRSEVDNGEFKYWPDGKEMGGRAYFNKYWAPYLKGFKICETYSACMYNSRQPFKDLSSNASGAVVVSEDSRTTLMLPDGTVVINFVAMGGSEDTEAAATSIIYVDVNGGKNPNVFGKDVFIFDRTQNGLVQPYGINSDNTVKSSCRKGGDGWACAAKIMKDGWSIKNDYPW